MSPRTSLVLFLTLALAIGFLLGIYATTQFHEKYERERALAATVLAMKYHNEGRVDEAVGLLHQATSNKPGLYASYRLLGDIYASQGKHGLAVMMYKESLDRMDEGGKDYSRFLSESGVEHDREAIRKKLDRSTLLLGSQLK